MQAVYSANQNKDFTADQVERDLVGVLQLKELPVYTKQIIEGFFEHRAELEQNIAEHLKTGWRLERINQTSLAIIEVALYEILYSLQIEPKAAVSEALNLCDEFSDPKNKAFINGILANFVK